MRGRGDLRRDEQDVFGAGGAYEQGIERLNDLRLYGVRVDGDGWRGSDLETAKQQRVDPVFEGFGHA